MRLLVFAAAIIGLSLAGCSNATSSPSAAASGPAVVTGDGFRLSLPAGWTSNSATTSNGYTTRNLDTGDPAVSVTVATLPIPNDSGNAQVRAIEKDDIVTLALTINGTTGTTPQITVPAHVVRFAGQSCARLGLAARAGGKGLSVTCRVGGVIYVVAASADSGDALNGTLNAVAAGWHWTR